MLRLLGDTVEAKSVQRPENQTVLLTRLAGFACWRGFCSETQQKSTPEDGSLNSPIKGAKDTLLMVRFQKYFQ